VQETMANQCKMSKKTTKATIDYS